MAGIPPLPPLRIKESDGSPNVIPVFDIALSNLTLTNLGGGKVLIDGAGGTGPAGPAGTLTIGSGITGGAVDGFLLMVSNGATLGQIDSSTFQRAVSWPLSIASGGTARTTAGSAHTLLGVNSSELSLTYYAILASNNAVVTKVGTTIFISATTAQGGNGVVLPGTAGNLAYYAISGTSVDDLVIGSAHTILGVNSSGASHTYYNLLASDNATIVKSGTGIFISATTNAAGAGGGSGTVLPGSANNLAYYASAGTAVDDLIIGSSNSFLGVNSSATAHEYKYLVASSNMTIVHQGSSVLFAADTGAGGGAPTSGEYVLYNLNVSLPAGKVLTASNNITITTNSTSIFVSANTGAGGGSGTVNAGSAGNLAYYAISGTAVDDLTIGSAHMILGVNSSGASHTYYNLLASDNATIVKSGTGIFISATTNAAGAGGGSGTVNPGTAGNLAFYAISGTAVDDLLIGSASLLLGVNSSAASHQYFALLGSNNMSVLYSGTAYTFSTLTNNIAGKQDSISFPLIVTSGGTGLATAGSGTTLIGMNSSGVVYDYYNLVASDNITIARQGTGYFISADTGASSGGIVQAGSGRSLAFYPSNGTTLSGSTVYWNTSNVAGVAPFRITINTATATSSNSGDFWFESSNNMIFLRIKSSSFIYSVELST